MDTTTDLNQPAVDKVDPLTDTPEARAIIAAAVQRLASRGLPHVDFSSLNTRVPGWQTTEFWLHVLTILGIIGTSLAGAGLPAKYATACIVVSTASYSISRGLAKMMSNNN